MNIVELQNISKFYFSNSIVTQAIKNVNLLIDNGEFIIITGASGSGKTTLLYVASGLEKTTSGIVKLFDEPILGMSERTTAELRKSKIGFVFQFYNLLPNLTVYENVLLAAVIAGNKNEDKVKTALEIVSMWESKHKYPNELSGGMQQRVAIARAIVNNPLIIFADEPTGNLDSVNAVQILEIFKKLNKEFSTTIVLVTHNSDFLSYASRSVILKDGVIVHDEKIRI
jgi:putative ABC transport system ATP-binding protein